MYGEFVDCVYSGILVNCVILVNLGESIVAKKWDPGSSKRLGKLKVGPKKKLLTQYWLGN